MQAKVNINKIYTPSENVVARDIQGELVIIPIVNSINDAKDEIFSLNKTGRAIWDKMDGKRSLKDIAEGLNSEFKGSIETIEKDVLGLTRELFKRKIIVEVK